MYLDSFDDKYQSQVSQLSNVKYDWDIFSKFWYSKDI